MPKHRIRPILAPGMALGLVAVWMTLMGGIRSAKSSAPAPDEYRVYLPLVKDPGIPIGGYFCYEIEFGLVWDTEVITLQKDGVSLYGYGPPDYDHIVTGTWVYTPLLFEVGFTNFRWPTATYELPDRLVASRYLLGPGFEVALDCTRR